MRENTETHWSEYVDGDGGTCMGGRAVVVVVLNRPLKQEYTSIEEGNRVRVRGVRRKAEEEGPRERVL